MAVENGFAFDPFQCSKCGRAFSVQHTRDRHEGRCNNIVFLEGEYEAEKTTQPPTYKELLEKESRKDPTHYGKYVGRRLITEPNNMIEVYHKIIRKGKNGQSEK